MFKIIYSVRQFVTAQVDTYWREEIKQTVSETNEKIKETNETVVKVYEEILTKMDVIESASKKRVDELQQVTTAECTKTRQEMLRNLDEKQKEITSI